MSQAHAEAYLDPGTPEEQSRRAFMANATIVLGSVIGLVIAVPLIGYSIPGKKINDLSAQAWSPVDANDWAKLTTNLTPLKVSFTRKTTDGYFLPEGTSDYVWGVKMNPTQFDKMKQERTDLFPPDAPKAAQVPYADQIYTAGYVIFSSICPHLGCRFAWDDSKNIFFCPCHNSTYDHYGERTG
ncbi:MAG: ubiquinol-cytochrome c reductase iron-sulfur subunit, partial [Vulcanimicrobiaceae bacterium]